MKLIKYLLTLKIRFLKQTKNKPGAGNRSHKKEDKMKYTSEQKEKFDLEENCECERCGDLFDNEHIEYFANEWWLCEKCADIERDLIEND